MVSQWDIYGKLCLHFNSKRLFTFAALLFSSSSLGTIPETAIIFPFFFKGILNPNPGGGGGVILPLPPSWFSLNNSKTVIAVTLKYCSVQ